MILPQDVMESWPASEAETTFGNVFIEAFEDLFCKNMALEALRVLNLLRLSESVYVAFS